MALSQEGYDSIDNTTGLLIKTAGYAGGIDSFKGLGTITFEALNTGEAAIELTSNSLALDAGNTNVTGRLDSSQITIATAEIIPEEEEEVTPEEEVAPEETVPFEEETTPEEEVTPEEEEETTPEEEEVIIPEEEELEPTPFIAAIGNILSLGTDNDLIVILVVIVIVAAAILLIAYFRRRSLRKKS
jgi:hypothetical protein